MLFASRVSFSPDFLLELQKIASINRTRAFSHFHATLTRSLLQPSHEKTLLIKCIQLNFWKVFTMQKNRFFSNARFPRKDFLTSDSNSLETRSDSDGSSLQSIRPPPKKMCYDSRLKFPSALVANFVSNPPRSAYTEYMAEPKDHLPNEQTTIDRLLVQHKQWRYWQRPPIEREPSAWEESVSAKDKTTFDFTLLSYNILSQLLLEDNSYLYHKTEPSILNWEYRRHNLLQEIVKTKADILCFQEMQIEHYFNFFLPKLTELGFHGLYKKRTGNKPDGCAIFFRTSLFELESHVELEFNQPRIPLLDRDNVGLLAVLRPALGEKKGPRESKESKICVATTHLLFNPRRGDIKLAQLQILLAELDKEARLDASNRGPLGHHPIILCGDMNSKPYSPLYQFIVSSRLNYLGLKPSDISGQKNGPTKATQMSAQALNLSPLGISPECRYYYLSPKNEASSSSWSSAQLPDAYTNLPCQLDHQFCFRSAYEHNDSQGRPFVTTNHARADCMVDYIFYSDGKKISSEAASGPLSLLGTYRLLTSQECQAMGGLPNRLLSSDHLSLMAKFRLKVADAQSNL